MMDTLWFWFTISNSMHSVFYSFFSQQTFDIGGKAQVLLITIKTFVLFKCYSKPRECDSETAFITCKCWLRHYSSFSIWFQPL